MKLVECGCCGFFHKETYQGDCRNDDERYTLEDITFFEFTDDIETVYLEDQIE